MCMYRGTSLIRKRHSLGSYSRLMPIPMVVLEGVIFV